MRLLAFQEAKPSILSRLWARIEPERFYRRKKVQVHVWGFFAFLSFIGCLIFSGNAYASTGDLVAAATDTKVLAAVLLFLTTFVKFLDTREKVKQDAKPRTGPRIPLADSSQFLTRAEFEEHVNRQEDRDGLTWAAVDGLRAEFAQFRLDQALGQDRQMARFDAMAAGQREVKDIVLRALSQREGKA